MTNIHKSYTLRRSSTHGLNFILNADFEGDINGQAIYVQNCHSYIGGNYDLPDDSEFTIYEGDYAHKVVSDNINYDDYISNLDDDDAAISEADFETLRHEFDNFCAECVREVEEMKLEFLKSHKLSDEYELEELLKSLSDEDNYATEDLEEKIEKAKLNA